MNDPATTDLIVPGARGELTVDDLVAQADKVREVQRRVMKAGIHYGVPFERKERGDGKDEKDKPKPSLLKAGAEVLCLLFRLAPEYEVVKSVETDTEISFTVRCNLVHIPTGIRYASGLASCSSRERKYMREARRRCPRCKQETIFPSKDEAGGWFCWGKKGGCGANFPEETPSIVDQPVGKVTNPDLYDQHNTILKMAQKRAFIGTTLNCTAASESFTQDLEDLTDGTGPDEVRGPPTNSHPRPAPSPRPSAAPTGKPSMKQLKRYHDLRDRLGVTEEQGRARVAAFLKRDVRSVADDVTGEEMDRITTAMAKETEKEGAA